VRIQGLEKRETQGYEKRGTQGCGGDIGMQV